MGTFRKPVEDTVCSNLLSYLMGPLCSQLSCGTPRRWIRSPSKDPLALMFLQLHPLDRVLMQDESEILSLSLAIIYSLYGLSFPQSSHPTLSGPGEQCVRPLREAWVPRS